MFITIEGTYSDGKTFTATSFPNVNISEFLAKNNVAISYDEVPAPAWWVTILSTLIPMLLIVGVILFFLQQSQGSGGKVMQFGKSRAKLHSDDRNKVTFKDVAGVDEV